MVAGNLINIIGGVCNYEEINKYSEIRMRNKVNGIPLEDCIYYQFAYSEKDTTKEGIVSSISYHTYKTFTRQSYDKKACNIPIEMYSRLLTGLKNYYYDICGNWDNTRLIAIDGTYNNDNKCNDMLNLGVYDVTNGVPIDITPHGPENKNQEIRNAENYIINNIETFKNSIIVCDRGYFSYNFINFLIEKNVHFIIRVKGKGDNLDPSKIIKPNTPKYNKIMKIRNNTRMIRYDNIIEKIIYAGNSKKYTKEYSLKIRNDCILVTNLLDDKIYTDEIILNHYKSRWEIEVFFKYLKSNHKFQHIKEESKDKYSKMYICELIITYIAKIIEVYYTKKLNKPNKLTINKSNLVNGIFNALLYDLLSGKLTDNKLDKFCRTHIKIIKNKENRSSPRTSKTPFTKWYIKGYSNLSKYMTIIGAMIKGDMSGLNKNLLTIANKIISINGKLYKAGD